MNQKWVGKDQKWVTNASDLGNMWIRKMSGDVDMSQTLVRSWSEVGQKLVRSRSEVGQKFVKHWSELSSEHCQTLVKI